MTKRENSETRNDYRHFVTLATRWLDNDVYGHINNVQYYGFFDTVVNRFLIERKLLDIHQGKIIGLVVETQCNYYRSAAFPVDIEAGVRVAHLGRSSVRYEVGLFVDGAAQPVAAGHFVHVYVDRAERRPIRIPQVMRTELIGLQVASEAGSDTG